MRYSPTTGQNIPDEWEQADMDQADDDLNRIVRFKEDLVYLLDSMRSENNPQGEWERCAAAMEEDFNELWSKEWSRLEQIAKSPVWSGIPTCQALREKLANERQRPFRNNPQTQPQVEKIEADIMSIFKPRN